jgi:hypothetical protein
MLPQPADPNKPDNFWEPVPGDHGAHGPFDDKARSFSFQLWATKHRMALAGGLLAGLGLTALLSRQHDEHHFGGPFS